MRILLYVLSCILSLHCSSQKIPKQLNYEDIELIDGSIIKQSELEDKIIVANLWGTWCKPCIAEIPELNAIVEKFKDNENILFLAIGNQTMDSSEKINKFLKKQAFNFTHIVPAKSSFLFNQVGTVSYPTTTVYNRNGRLEKKIKGSLEENDLQILEQLIEDLSSNN